MLPERGDLDENSEIAEFAFYLKIREEITYAPLPPPFLAKAF